MQERQKPGNSGTELIEAEGELDNERHTEDCGERHRITASWVTKLSYGPPPKRGAKPELEWISWTNSSRVLSRALEMGDLSSSQESYRTQVH